MWTTWMKGDKSTLKVSLYMIGSFLINMGAELMTCTDGTSTSLLESYYVISFVNSKWLMS